MTHLTNAAFAEDSVPSYYRINAFFHNSEHERKACTHRILSSKEQGLGVLYSITYDEH
jgi:hypothetical protein